MTVTVSGNKLTGRTAVIASKSSIHRLLICAALCDTPTVIEHVSYSQDIEATVNCIQAALADVVCEQERIIVTPRMPRTVGALLDCGESGSTLRFLLPIIAAIGGGRFTGRGRLSQRPLTPIYDLLEANGCCLSEEGHFPISVNGRLVGHDFTVDGTISSQFVSGLLMAAPLLGDGCRIRVTGEMTSFPYIALTVEAMARFGVSVYRDGQSFTVRGQYRSSGSVMAEGDWSNAAFWLVGAAISHSADYRLTGVAPESLQGDRRLVNLLCEAGFSITEQTGEWQVDGSPKQALHINAADIPDLVPILSVLATTLPGETVIDNAARLIHKESNRLQSTHAMITALGGTVTETADGLLLGPSRLRGGTVDGCNDHRIVMSAAIAALVCEGPVTISGAEAVSKSYPHFFEELEKRGVQVCRQFGEEN